MRKFILFFFIIATFCLGFTYPPEPIGGVSDFANALTSIQRTRINERLHTFQKNTGAQALIAILSSIEGLPIEEISNELFKRWGVGRKDKSNGILLVIAIQERKARIETGYGVEDILPDALAGRLIRQDLAPFFARSEYYTGLLFFESRLEEVFKAYKEGRPFTKTLVIPNGILFIFIIITIFLILFLNRLQRQGRVISSRGGISVFRTGSWNQGWGGDWSNDRNSRSRDWFLGGGGLSGGGGASGSW